MTTYHDDEHKTLDLKRGVRLARWAYFSRKKQEPLMIESASFRSCNGETLATYTAEQHAKPRRNRRRNGDERPRRDRH